MNPHLRVLIVEDAEDDMFFVLRELRRGGYIVDSMRVETPKQMQDALHLQAWDLVIADYTLPAFSAPEALKLIQSQHLDIPFIIVSGTIGEDTAIAAMKAGAHDYLIKGNLARLMPAVERELREAQERQKRHRAEQALRESEERYRTICQFTSDYIYSSTVLPDKTFRHEWISPGPTQLTGYSPEELDVDSRWLSVIHPDDLPRVEWFIANLLAHCQPQSLEYRIVAKSGEIRWIRDRIQPLWDDVQARVVSFLGAIEDITDRKQAEARLRQREEFLSRIYDGAEQAIFVIDVTAAGEFRYLGFNRVSERYGGVSDREIQGKTPQDVFGSEIGATMQQNYERCLQAGTSISYEEQLVFADHSIWTLTTLSPLRDEHGRIDRIIGTATDISDRKQAELALQQQLAREKLVADISQSIRQTLDANEVLQRTVEQVRDFLKTDRAIVFRFQSDWQGSVITESVAPDWVSILGTQVADGCFAERYVEPYRQGRISAISDLRVMEVDPCYLDLLTSFQVTAHLIVPILQGDRLWGLLIAHHCSAPRQWHSTEIELLLQLATQVGIAIQQSELYQQTRRELLERQQMQEALQESEERFRSLSASAPIGIRYTNADGICLYANARWQEMSGLSQEDCLGNGWTQAIHPDDRDAAIAAWEAAIDREREFSANFRFLTPQQDIRFCCARAAPMRSATGELVGYVSTEEDITERRDAERKIREQAALLDIATDAIFVRDLDHHILFWNKGAERLYGWEAAEVLDRSAAEVLYKAGEMPPKFDEIRAILDRDGCWQGELQQVKKSGKYIIVESRWTLVRDEEGNPKSILNVNTDITEKKQLEAQFLRVQRLESLGTLASGIAHDFNNILTPVLTTAQLLPLKLPDLDARSLKMLKLVEDSAKRGAELVKQILAFARGGDGKRIPLQVKHLLSEVVQVIRQTFPKAIELRADIPGKDLWTVSADATQLHQVLMNLCVNARDAMPNGGILRLEIDNMLLDEAYTRINLEARTGPYVVITVADTGTGIGAELLDRIFDPFFTTKEVGKGTGLGLSTVLGIVQNHGGFIRVESEVGGGTQFQVYLPAVEDRVARQREKVERASGHQELILIVDDEPLIQEVMKTALETHNYRTLAARNGTEAIELYAQHQDEVGAILMDIMMPTMDGLTALRTLQKLNPNVKAIATSGLTSNSVLVEDSGIGVKAFLAKPYTAQELLETLQRVLESS
jgi:PAS domain S-box-containing protein